MAEDMQKDLMLIRIVLKGITYDASPLWHGRQGGMNIEASVSVKEVTKPSEGNAIAEMLYVVKEKATSNEIMSARLEGHFHFKGELALIGKPPYVQILVHSAMQHGNLWLSTLTGWSGPVPLMLVHDRHELKH